MIKHVLDGVLLLSFLSATLAGQERSAISAQEPAARRVEIYESAIVDAGGNIRITTSDHRVVGVEKDGEITDSWKQTAFRQPIVSSGRTAVGSLAEYRFCCTSYDIPLELVIYAAGGLHRFRGRQLPIFTWHFADAGTRVAYGQQTVHFSCTTHYELRDIQFERLIDSADVPQDCGQIPVTPTVKLPK